MSRGHGSTAGDGPTYDHVTMLAGLGRKFRRGFGRVTPEPFVLAVGLTLCVAAFALLRALGGGGEPAGVLAAWGAKTGLWTLSRFAMQICTMLVLGYALAEAPPVQAALSRLINLARTPRQLVAATAFFACGLGLLNWSLGLIGGAVLARHGGRLIRERGISLHYPLLCAAGYSGLMVWHGGLSGSAPLKVTRQADVQGVLGPELGQRFGVLGLDETLFGNLNLVVSGGLLLLAPLVFAALTPDREDIAEAPAEQAEPRSDSTSASAQGGWLDRIDDARIWCILLALMILTAVVVQMQAKGWSKLDLDTVNALLWAGALLAQGRPKAFLSACGRGMASCSGVLICFPLYAGIMALMKISGLSEMLTALVAGAGRELLPFASFLSAATVNLFVPSGGGQWAVQGPILVEAALDTQTPLPTIVMSLAYGDQLTNMLQPFWAIPLLAMTGVRARDIVGYCVIWMLVGMAFIGTCLLLW